MLAAGNHSRPALPYEVVGFLGKVHPIRSSGPDDYPLLHQPSVTRVETLAHVRHVDREAVVCDAEFLASAKVQCDFRAVAAPVLGLICASWERVEPASGIYAPQPGAKRPGKPPRGMAVVELR